MLAVYYATGSCNTVDIHRHVKINDKTEQCFGVVMTQLSSSKQ